MPGLANGSVERRGTAAAKGSTRVEGMERGGSGMVAIDGLGAVSDPGGIARTRAGREPNAGIEGIAGMGGNER